MQGVGAGRGRAVDLWASLCRVGSWKVSFDIGDLTSGSPQPISEDIFVFNLPLLFIVFGYSVSPEKDSY